MTNEEVQEAVEVSKALSIFIKKTQRFKRGFDALPRAAKSEGLEVNHGKVSAILSDLEKQYPDWQEALHKARQTLYTFGDLIS
jgi:TolA-binding protein